MKINKYLAPFFFLLIVYFAGINVPMHSDDYSYLLLGTDLDAHIHHYLSWSGRFVADYVSGFLLGQLNYYAYTFLNSLALTTLLYTITLIPSIIDKTYKFNSFRFLCIAMMYWVANPNLGETSFWIVGSANYLWTNMFISIFLAYYLHILNKERVSSFNLLLTFILGIVAGCSNENTSVVLSLLVILSVFISPKIKISIFSSAAVIAGSLFLLLAPGNYMRSSSSGFTYWSDFDFIQKIWITFFDRLPLSMSSYWQVYFVIISALLVISIKGFYNRKSFIISIAFMVSAIAANAAFLAAPAMPPRALNGALSFLLIASSILIHNAYREEIKTDIYSKSILLLFLAFYFIPSYAMFSYAVYKTSYQAKVREQIINEAKHNKKEDVLLPQWYFSRLAKQSDIFDMFHSGSLAKYYGLNSTEVYNVNFDYGQLLQADRHDLNVNLINGAKIIAAYPYMDFSTWKRHILFEFNEKSINAFKESNALIIHLNKGDGGFINADTPLKLTTIGNRLFIDASFSQINLSEIKSIRIGVYDSSNQEDLTNEIVKVQF
ncbi:hypothetical protein J4V89_19060 [Escherichia coli]